MNLTEGGTHASINDDGSVTLSKQDSSTVPLPPGSGNNSANKGNSFTVDADNDGRDDIGSARTLAHFGLRPSLWR